MKVCIVGAGAIGCFVGARLAAAGHAVSAFARGATLDALRGHGWRLIEAGAEGDRLLHAPIAAASNDARDLGPQQLVVIAVKGPALAAVAGGLAPLIDGATLLLPAMNGVPWWFHRGVPALGGEPLASVDAGGAIDRALPFDGVLGCVVHASAAQLEPGLVQLRSGRGLIVGEPGGGVSERVDRLVRQLGQAGFDATASSDVRQAIWYKLWGNMTMNPVSALTGASADQVLDDPLVRGFCTTAMSEAAAVGERIGCAIAQSPTDRHAVTRKLGAFKTSMLQDAEAGRAIELDAIVGVVREIAQRVGVATPAIDALFGLARLFGRVHGLYPPQPGTPVGER